MKKIITNQNARVGDWVAKQLGKSSAWGTFQAIGLEQDGKLIAGVVIDGYQKDRLCSIHCAGLGKTWLNREFLFVVFDYVFRQLNVKAVVNPVDAANHESARFTKHLGFLESARIPEAELLIFTMPRDACRWLKRKD